MKKLMLLIFMGVLFTGCMGTRYVSMQEVKSRVASYDTNYTDVLTVHCRTPMPLIVSFQRNNYECKSGDVITLTYNFPLIYSSRGANSARVPVLIYPQGEEYSEISGLTSAWYIYRSRNSDESWLIELSRYERLIINKAR